MDNNNNIRLIRRCQNATCYNDMERERLYILLWSGLLCKSWKIERTKDLRHSSNRRSNRLQKNKAKFIQPQTIAASELVSCPVISCPAILCPAFSVPQTIIFLTQHLMRLNLIRNIQGGPN